MATTMSNANVGVPLYPPLAELQPAQRDRQLLTAAKAGSDEAFAELRRLYARKVYHTILRITKNREDAEDVLQDAFLRAYLALHSFEGRSSFYSWVTRIATNSALMVLRKRRTHPEVSFDLPVDGADDLPSFEVKDSSPSPEQIFLGREQWVRMLHSIQALQPKLQGAIQIWMASEGSLKEIALTLGISVASVKTRLYRAREKLGSKRNLAKCVR